MYTDTAPQGTPSQFFFILFGGLWLYLCVFSLDSLLMMMSAQLTTFKALHYKSTKIAVIVRGFCLID